MRVDLMDVAQYQVQMAMASGWQEVATFETHTEALAKKQAMDAAYPHIAFQIAEVPYNDAPISEFTRANPGRYEAWCENAMDDEARQEANEQAEAPRKRTREYAASAGAGSRGAIEAVTIRASTPQEAHTKLMRLGYTRITGITAL